MSSGTTSGPAGTPAAVPGATEPGSHHAHQVALWVKMHSAPVVNFVSAVSLKLNHLRRLAVIILIMII